MPILLLAKAARSAPREVRRPKPTLYAFVAALGLAIACGSSSTSSVTLGPACHAYLGPDGCCLEAAAGDVVATSNCTTLETAASASDSSALEVLCQQRLTAAQSVGLCGSTVGITLPDAGHDGRPDGTTSNPGAGSCALEGASCTDRACCSGVCSRGACACTEVGGNCQTGTECCSGVCAAGLCADCNDSGGLCTENANCCSGRCQEGVCGCSTNGGGCQDDDGCCTGVCQSGTCACVQAGSSCDTDSLCCSGSCMAGVCQCIPSCDGVTCGGSDGCGGQCGETGQTSCSGACVDLTSDASNCGSCGHVCGSDFECESGSCTCGFLGTVCGKDCVDTTSDPNNCGTCGTTCGANMACHDGSCDCTSDYYLCGATCIVLNQPDNCGGCGIVCGNMGASGAVGVCCYGSPYCDQGMFCCALDTCEPP